jgi:hypothetical protein
VVTHGKLLHDSKDLLIILKALLITKLVGDEEQYENASGSAQRQTQCVNERIVFLLNKIAKGYFQVVAKHGKVNLGRSSREQGLYRLPDGQMHGPEADFAILLFKFGRFAFENELPLHGGQNDAPQGN